MKKRNKALIIGLDGATFNVINPLLKEGKLPVLKELIENGAHGILESVLPTNSYAAWASFMTGKNPGKHGIFDFRKQLGNNLEKKAVVNSRFLREETIFQIVSRHGLKSGAINIPLTFPPYKINGFMISGILIPKVSREIFYPQNLYEGIISRFGEYIVDISWNCYKNKINKLIEDILLMTKKRKEVLLFLMEKYDWDILVVVFVGPDRIQHPLLKFLDPEHSLYSSSEKGKYEDKIKDYYFSLDESLGEIIRQAGEETNIFILSDHGFHPSNIQFKVNQFLKDIGMLEFSKRKSGLRNFLNKFDTPKVRKLRRAIIPNVSKYSKIFSSSRAINWKRTKAYSSLDYEQGISINLKGRELFGVVQPGNEYDMIREKIKSRLLNLYDPLTHKKVIKKVFFRENIFKGGYFNEAPDIVFEPLEAIYLGREKSNNFEPLEWASGDHDRDGILISSGNNIKRKKRILDGKIIDLVPTILYSLGLPIPEDMDGKVLMDLFTEDFIKKNRIITEKKGKISSLEKNDKEFEKVNSKKLEKQLKGLGYLD